MKREDLIAPKKNWLLNKHFPAKDRDNERIPVNDRDDSIIYEGFVNNQIVVNPILVEDKNETEDKSNNCMRSNPIGVAQMKTPIMVRYEI